MSNFNLVILMGRLTRDVEFKYTQTGTEVAEIGLAVNERRKNQQTGEWIEEPVFVDITLWGGLAKVANQYLSKGSPVLIEGRLKYDTWDKDGQKRSKLRVVGEKMQMLGKFSQPAPNSSEPESHAASPANTKLTDDDIPF